MGSHEGPVFSGHPLFPFADACNEAGAQCLAQRLLHGSEAHPLSPIKTVRDASDGGAASGHSDVTHQVLMPHTATATAVSGHAGAILTQPASPDSVVTAPKPAQAAAASPASAPVAFVDDLVPLPPPNESEGPEAAAEYELYLQRWDAGDTLAQRWHRLAQQDKLGDIRDDWEDWQLDVLLEQVKGRAQAAQLQQRAGTVTPSIGGSRLRRARAETDDVADSPAEEPRRVRSRRVPSTLQDYHVENAPSRTPDRQDTDAAAGAYTISVRQQQLLGGQVATAVVSDDSNDEAPYTTMQQLQQQRPGLPRPPSAAQHAAKRPASRMQRPVMTAAQQQQVQQQMQQARQFAPVVTPYNSHIYQHQQMQAQVQAQQQARLQYQHQQYQQQQEQQQQQAQQQQQQQEPQQMMAMMQQLMMQLQGNGQPGQNAQVPPEMTELWFKIGSALGAMMQEKGGPALLTNPQAMCSMVDAVLKQTTGDPDAAMQQLAATMAAARIPM